MEKKLSPEAVEELNNHKTDISTFWDIYGGIKGLFKSIYFKFSLIISTVLCALCFLLDNLYSFDIMLYVLDKVLSIFPDIIGFNIGAYALVIGFGQKNVVDRLSVKVNNSKYSLFQTMGSTFAFSVLVQSLTISLSFFLDLFINNFGQLNLLNFSDRMIDYMNGLAFYVLLFLTTYSFILIPKIVLNVFGFSQLYHFYNNRDNQKEK